MIQQPDYPDWFTSLRPHQEQAISEIVKHFKNGAKVVFLDAPTGAGKTLIGEEVRRRLEVKGANYTCTTKTLQDQFAHDYEYAKVLKGRGNYPTLNKPWLFEPGSYMSLSCEDCNLTSMESNDCDYCSDCYSCPYRVAKGEASSSPVAVLNTSYLLREWQAFKSAFRDRELTIIDECDLLESNLLNFAEVRISERRQEQWGIKHPISRTKPDTWVAWVKETVEQLQAYRNSRSFPRTDRRAQKEKKSIDSLLGNINALHNDLLENPESWVLTEYESNRTTKAGEQTGPIVFKPVWVRNQAREYLWEQSDGQFLLMSASIISPESMADSLGLVGEYDYQTVYVDSTFPVENRPIYVSPVADMAKSKGQESWLKLGGAIEALLKKHPTERVLIHTVSYPLAEFLYNGLSKRSTRDILTYTSAATRESVLLLYKQTPNAVLVAPSMDRGIDLPNDLCRVQIIAKVPYPYLGDKQVSAKLYSPGGQMWYGMETIRTMVQMTGRGVRHKEDFAVSYILDWQFVNRVWKDNRRLMPKWWQDALVWDTGGLVRELTT